MIRLLASSFFFPSRRRHTWCYRDWSSDVCSSDLYRATAELARRERLPVAVHLAESREETALVRDGAGPFADGLRARGIPVPAHNCTPVQYLSRLGVLQRATGWLCIHCAQVGGPA